MKRRAFIGTLAIVPAASATALAQPPAAAQPATPPPSTQAPSPSGPGAAPPPPPGLPDPLTYASADEAGVTVTRYFTAVQFAALDRLARLFIPSGTGAGAPGAADAGAARFLDFYVGKSPVERQTLYKSGLDGLNTRAKKRFSKAFGETDDTQADAIVMEFLGRPWSYAPSDQMEAFLRTALRDVRRATQNSPAGTSVAQSTPPTMVNWLRPL